MPIPDGGEPNNRPGAPNQNTGNAQLPPVLKNEKPSQHILKYMDGLSKRILKITETQLNPKWNTSACPIYFSV